MGSISKYILLEAYKDEPAEIKKIISKISSLSHKRSRLNKAGQDVAGVNDEIQKMKDRLLELKKKNNNNPDASAGAAGAGADSFDADDDNRLSGIWDLDDNDFNTAVNDSVEARKILKYVLANEFILTDDDTSAGYMDKMKLGITPCVCLYGYKRDVVDNMSLEKLQSHMVNQGFEITLDNKKLSIIYSDKHRNHISAAPSQSREPQLYYCKIPNNNTDNYIITGKITELYTNLPICCITDNYQYKKGFNFFDLYLEQYSRAPITFFKKITCDFSCFLKEECVINNQEINITNNQNFYGNMTFKYIVPALTVLNQKSHGHIFDNTTINFINSKQNFMDLDISNIDLAHKWRHNDKYLSEIYDFNELTSMTPEQRLADLNNELNLYRGIFNFNSLKTNCMSIFIRHHSIVPKNNPFIMALGLEYINNSLIYLKQILELPETAGYDDICAKIKAFNIINNFDNRSFNRWLDKILMTLHYNGKKINRHNVNFKFKFPKLSINYVNNLFGNLPLSINSIYICTTGAFIANKPTVLSDYYGFYLKKHTSYWELKPAFAVRKQQ